jgi:hypothetical protein
VSSPARWDSSPQSPSRTGSADPRRISLCDSDGEQRCRSFSHAPRQFASQRAVRITEGIMPSLTVDGAYHMFLTIPEEFALAVFGV